MIGETIGNFKIVSRLGRGGMGEVWLAEQQSIGTKVAIKLLNANISEDTEHVQRFFNEARAVSRIQHAGIVKIFDVGHLQSGTTPGQAYLIMEFLEGETLAARIARTRRLPLTELAEVGRQVASVLDATHNAGITHRDLKPDNIYLVADREMPRGERVKILDFGIAKLTGTLAVVSPRTTGTMGTPTYMAPEQWGDASKVDWRADLYSLGCVAFEMATGRPPFICTNIAEACAKHLADPPPHVRELVPDLPPALDELVDRLLAKSPQARASSMREVERAFASLPTSEPMAFADTLPPTRSPPAMTSDGRISATAMETAKTRSRGPLRFLSIIAVIALAGFAGLVAIKKMQRRSITVVTPRPDQVVIADARNPDDAAMVTTAVVPLDAAPAQPHAPTKEGKIDADAALRVAANDNVVRQCYANALIGDPALSGTVTAMVTVSAKGTVIKASATGMSPGVARCIARRLEQLKYPRVTGGDYALVSMPFTFAPPAASADEPEKLSTEAINEGMARIKAPLDACDSAGGEGDGTMQVWVSPDGTVSKAQVVGDVAGTPAAGCIEKILAKATFAKSKTGTHITVKFHLSKP